MIYLAKITTPAGHTSTWKIDAASILFAADQAGRIDDESVRAFLCGRGTLQIAPVPAFSEFPSLTCADWKRCFERNGFKCPWSSTP